MTVRRALGLPSLSLNVNPVSGPRLVVGVGGRSRNRAEARPRLAGPGAWTEPIGDPGGGTVSPSPSPKRPTTPPLSLVNCSANFDGYVECPILLRLDLIWVPLGSCGVFDVFSPTGTKLARSGCRKTKRTGDRRQFWRWRGPQQASHNTSPAPFRQKPRDRENQRCRP